MSEHGAAEAVDEGVAAAVTHGEPVADQEDQVDELELVDETLDWPTDLRTLMILNFTAINGHLRLSLNYFDHF